MKSFLKSFLRVVLIAATVTGTTYASWTEIWWAGYANADGIAVSGDSGSGSRSGTANETSTPPLATAKYVVAPTTANSMDAMASGDSKHKKCYSWANQKGVLTTPGMNRAFGYLKVSFENLTGTTGPSGSGSCKLLEHNGGSTSVVDEYTWVYDSTWGVLQISHNGTYITSIPHGHSEVLAIDFADVAGSTYTVASSNDTETTIGKKFSVKCQAVITGVIK